MIENENYDNILNNYWNTRDMYPYIFQLDKQFPRNSSQGIVGLIRLKKDNQLSKPCLFKVSQTIDYSINHEFYVSEGLKTLASYCFNFCRPIGLI